VTPAPAQVRAALRLRPVVAEDGALLFEWLNRPDSLAASLETSSPVPREAHKIWCDARLADPRTRIWIVERNAAPVGSVRLQDKGDGPEVAIYIDAAARGAGVASIALGLALDEARTVWPGSEAIARIRPDNAASQRLFERTGFTLRRQTEKQLIYRRAL